MQLTKQILPDTHLTLWRGIHNKDSENNFSMWVVLFLGIKRKFNRGINADGLKVLCSKDTWPPSRAVFTPRLESCTTRWLACLPRAIPEPPWSPKPNSARQGSPGCFSWEECAEQSQGLNTHNKALTPGDVLSARPFVILEKLRFRLRAQYRCSLAHFKTSTEPFYLLDNAGFF